MSINLNLALTMPALFVKMMLRVVEMNATVFTPDRGKADPDARLVAINMYGGFGGPWVDVPSIPAL